jgi:hypothetical protein
MPPDFRSSEFDDFLLSVWRQTLVDSAKSVALGGDRYPVRRTAKHKLAQVDFEFEGAPYAAWSKIPRPNRAGLSWRARDRR